MLVLGRKVGQKIYIGTDIVIEVVQATRDGRMRLAISAPRTVEVLRHELLRPADQAAFERAAGHTQHTKLESHE